MIFSFDITNSVGTVYTGTVAFVPDTSFLASFTQGLVFSLVVAFTVYAFYVVRKTVGGPGCE